MKNKKIIEAFLDDAKGGLPDTEEVRGFVANFIDNKARGGNNQTTEFFFGKILASATNKKKIKVLLDAYKDLDNINEFLQKAGRASNSSS